MKVFGAPTLLTGQISFDNAFNDSLVCFIERTSSDDAICVFVIGFMRRKKTSMLALQHQLAPRSPPKAHISLSNEVCAVIKTHATKAISNDMGEFK